MEPPFDPDQSFTGGLREGFFLKRRDHQQKVPLAIRIFFGPPADPVTGQPLDRSPRWQVEIGGYVMGSENPPRDNGYEIKSLVGIWPECARHPITADDYRYLCGRQGWARQHDEHDPFNGHARVNPMTAPIPTGD